MGGSGARFLALQHSVAVWGRGQGRTAAVGCRKELEVAARHSSVSGSPWTL